MNFSRFLDIQSWWEVPSIAYFCSLFRTAFNLLDFDIEELEEALLTDGTEESGNSLLTELIVRLLNGCLGNNDISAFNYQMYLRRLFRQKCQETGRYNPFNTDIDFQFLPLRTKVEILYALCDFRLDAEDVFDLFKNLEAESLRVEPLGWDDNDSAYWYFYGTRLYREDILKKPRAKSKKKRSRESRKRGWFYGDDWLDDEESERVWQVVCFTEEDWTHLTEKFSKATSKVEKELYRSLSQNFLPEIPRLFQEKERLQRKRLLELAPRRTSSRVLQKIKQKEEERKQSVDEDKEEEDNKQSSGLARDTRARRRNLLRSKSVSSDSSDESSESSEEEMPQKVCKKPKLSAKRSKNSSSTHKGEPPPDPPVRTGRKTNNSLACATGQIVIPDNDEPVNSTRKKLKTSQIFSQTDEDVQIDMYKVLEQLSAHDDAWPFMDPVEEEYAPNYYAVIRRPMDLRKMEERLDSGYYTDFNMFKADFKLIVNNCRLYNGQDNEYTVMVDNLQAAFDRLTEKYIHRVSSSDEEIAVEYQLPTPSRKHKLKTNESPVRHKRKKRKSQSDTGEPKSSCSEPVEQEQEEEEEKELPETSDEVKPKESHKSKEGKEKKKRKGHHRHGKHSKNHKKTHRSEHESRSRHSKKLKHAKNKDREGKKSKRKKSKHQEPIETEEPLEQVEVMKRSESQESIESSNRSRSASPLPSIHTPTPTPSPTPSPTELDKIARRERRNRREFHEECTDQLADPDFYKDKYDKIKERRRHAARDAWESLFDSKQKLVDTQKQNLHIPEKERNQKLRETIEKLKAKNEKYRHSSLFNSLFAAHSGAFKRKNSNTKESRRSTKDNDDDNTDEEEEEEEEEVKEKPTPKKRGRKSIARNESATVALEQAVKDISKWLDDAPKGSTSSSPSDSPAQTISTEDQDNSRQDDESSQEEKPLQPKKEVSRKRPSSREPKLVKRREIQRTIDRLQPGKSKGNLLTNMSIKNSDKLEDSVPTGPLNKAREIVKTEESSPKLSLGSVLPSVEFSLGSDHNFINDDKIEEKKETDTTETKLTVAEEVKIETKKEDKVPVPTKKDAEVETDLTMPPKPSQEKATPNLSAWFKAFGTPKATTSTILAKKKNENHETDDKVTDKTNTDSKLTKNAVKYDPPSGQETPLQEGGESPLPHASNTPRQRRTSTGSSISERSSFSQDLDSPRHQMSHNSPLLRSPASPRHDDFQKISYPIINGTVRAGFYQDTTSVKSSPEKSCSPREMPQSPYSPYSQHVYISNNATGSATPNYFVDHNKSPLPTYGQNAPSYYDASKSPMVCKPIRVDDDFTPSGPEQPQQSPYNGPYSPTTPPYPQVPTKSYSQTQVSPHPSPVTTNPMPATSTIINSDSKTTHFPVKKRTYNEPEELTKKAIDPKDIPLPPKNEHPKITQSAHNIAALSNTSVDDIALALCEKSEIAKLNTLREKNTLEYVERHVIENRDIGYETNETINESKNLMVNVESMKSIAAIKKDSVDMVNMGYMNPDVDRRNNNETHEVIDFAKPSALNLGINNTIINHPTHKTLAKANVGVSNMTPAHSHDRQIVAERINQNIAHAHHSQYDATNFSLSDIELANKKLYACNAVPSTAAIDYGNWKVTNQIRKSDILPSDYSTTYNANNEDKLKGEINVTNTAAINYNKNLQQQQQQYNSYNNVPRASLQRSQEMGQNLPAELRIPNPRAMIKHDHLNVLSAHGDADSMAKNLDSVSKSHKTEKLLQNHPHASPTSYKTSYNTHPARSLDTLRSIPNIPQMLERYSNDERYLSSFATTSASLYHDKSFSMFNKSLASDVNPISTAYSQPSSSINKDSNLYKTSPSIASTQVDTKAKTKRKRTAENKSSPVVGSQAYHTSTCSTDIHRIDSVKPNIMPASAFNFGTTPNMALGGALYGDNGAFSIEDFRNSTNQLMAANYMAAAVAHQQRNTAEASAEKLVKPAHQNSTHSSGSFPFIGHGQVRAGYPFVSAESSSPLYQQYLQRHQEELLRQTGAQIMSLYSPAYPAALGVRPPPYDAINRHSWL
ncbi:uncharacterized protein dikar [Battus philenor]|uniref:uncharacterized protein dikar n=1 Tax=Battus philenor TaxID=42288 RepID=UPI0035CE9DFF